MEARGRSMHAGGMRPGAEQLGFPSMGLRRCLGSSGEARDGWSSGVYESVCVVCHTVSCFIGQKHDWMGICGLGQGLRMRNKG